MNRTSPVRAPYFGLAITLIACSGKTLDVGSHQHAPVANTSIGAGGSGNPPAQNPLPDVPPLPEWPDLSNCQPTASAPITGEWTGYALGSEVPGWEGNLKLTFLGMSGDKLCGTVTFGDAEPPPPPTDPAEVYPPDSGQGFGGGPGTLFITSPVQGLPYTMLSPSMDGQRLQFSITYSEIARAWCPLQTSYLSTDRTYYSCLPGNGGGYDGNCFVTDAKEQRTYVSCTQYAWCMTNRMCACAASGCVATPHAIGAAFDIRVDGDEAEGVAGDSPLFLQRLP